MKTYIVIDIMANGEHKNIYLRDKYQILHNVLSDVAKVMVSLREEDLIEDGVIILENKR